MEPIRSISLALVVLMSLILPFTASVRLCRYREVGRALRTVWIGQSLCALAGLWTAFAPVHPELGVLAAAVACLACVIALRRQVRRPARHPA